MAYVIPTGQDVLALAMNRLLGLQNSVSTNVLLDYVNEGKDEIWSILKSLNEQYFGAISQNSDPTQVNYFPALATNQRTYALPPDLREIQFIETNTVGYTELVWTYSEVNKPAWQSARKSANADSSIVPNVLEYLYTIWDKNTFLLAQFPEVALSLTLYYIRSLPDFVFFSGGTAAVTNGSPTVTLSGTAFSQAQMNQMVGADVLLNGLDIGTIASVNQSAQTLTLTANVTAPTQSGVTYTITNILDEILVPYHKKIADYAVQKVALAEEDETAWAAWKETWKADVLMVTSSAAPRNEANPVFVEDFEG